MRVKLSRGDRLNRCETKSPPGNGPYCFRIRGQIDHLVSPLYPSESDKPDASGFAGVTTNVLENRLKQGCMAGVMQRLDEVLRRIIPIC
jgi:hypothetical protein